MAPGGHPDGQCEKEDHLLGGWQPEAGAKISGVTSTCNMITVDPFRIEARRSKQGYS